MKTITAKILDSTHLELSKPVTAKAGELIKITLPDKNVDEKVWQEASKKKFLKAYSDEDSIYDEL